jgi:RNase P subunit RPR2
MNLICPRCGSPLKPADDTFFRMGRDMQRFICEKCGYMGALAVEADEKGEQEKDLKKPNK